MGVQEIDTWDMVGSFPTCPLCKGSNVVRDAWARWNSDRREWELHAVFDAMLCDDCGDEITTDWQLDEKFRAKRVRRLNDAARRGEGPNLTIVVTSGVQSLGEEGVAAATAAISAFDDFTQDNDP